ncbi:hypothetical protein [Leucothrix pacifica]|uniref:4Fe-4S ferredoxin-type domain-containing protein n=1 Tax=Leucothrix pacifica TaxID=1247513 RepID=A0A317C2A3_9GAMM|nr:hypothetical protein [Leucothrix pacifica]PWQ92479.1 hypothetical protein DKW60_21020 [Leucothrix pacifica]
MSVESTPFELFQSEMADSGLVLCEAQPLSALPQNIWLTEDKLERGSFLLIGHAGRLFWQALQRENIKGSDPVDRFSSEASERAIQKYLPDIDRKLLFPADDCPINLMALGKAFGWHHASPLGMGIHRKYGLWSAYRALWWLDTEDLKSYSTLDEQAISQPKVTEQILPAIDICAECETQECVTACPAEAVSYHAAPNLSKCADYRLEQESHCVSTCLSRIACPYAQEYRYSTEQMSYHYGLARSAIAVYRSQVKV